MNRSVLRLEHVGTPARLIIAAVVALLATLVLFGTHIASADGAVVCHPVTTSKGSMNAAQVGGNVTGMLDATGCDIGVYYDAITGGGSITDATIYGAMQYGVFVDGTTTADGISGEDVAVNVTGSTIKDIGDSPFSGGQHGVGIYYYGYGTPNSVSGTVSGNIISKYQKGGIAVNGSKANVTVTNNNIAGLGQIQSIAQNGIQFGYGASGEARGNVIDGNWYTGANWTSTGLLLFDVNAASVMTSHNKFVANQTNVALVESNDCSHEYGGVYEDWGLCLYP